MNVFVFGTLMYPRILAALLGEVPAMQDALLEGYRRARIAVPGREAKGPAIEPSEGSIVKGKVLFNLSDRQLRVLDLFETAATGYERIKGRAELFDGRQADVEFYEATEELRPHLLDQDWSEEDFERHHHDMYVNERVPALLRAWTAQGVLD